MKSLQTIRLISKYQDLHRMFAMLCNDNTISSSKINRNLIALNKGIPTQLISLNSKATCFFFKKLRKITVTCTETNVF